MSLKNQIIGKYRFDEFLGKGSYGNVHKAIHLDSKKAYAVKSMYINNSLSRKSADTEKQMLELVRNYSPYLINMEECFDEDDFRYFVLELCEHSNLDAFINYVKENELSIDERRIWKIFSQCLLALAALENFNIVHRDIKGENLFIMKDNTVKLGDFGVSRTLDGLSNEKLTHNQGTPLFMAPEMINSDINSKDCNYNTCVDIWSMGVVLYNIMEFEYPFSGYSPYELMKNIINNPYRAFSSKFSETLKSVVGRMLVKEPQNRIKLKELLFLPEVCQSIIDNQLVVPPNYQNFFSTSPIVSLLISSEKKKENCITSESNVVETINTVDHLFSESKTANTVIHFLPESETTKNLIPDGRIVPFCN